MIAPSALFVLALLAAQQERPTPTPYVAPPVTAAGAAVEQTTQGTKPPAELAARNSGRAF